jgi:hypothetical protein
MYQGIENLPFPQSEEERPHSLFCLRRFPYKEMKLSSYMPFLLALRSKILKRVVTPS